MANFIGATAPSGKETVPKGVVGVQELRGGAHLETGPVRCGLCAKWVGNRVCRGSQEWLVLENEAKHFFWSSFSFWGWKEVTFELSVAKIDPGTQKLCKFKNFVKVSSK